MARGKTKRRSKKSTAKKTRFIVLIILLLCSLLITVGEQYNLPLPTWDDIYAPLLGEKPAVSTALDIPGTDTKIHFIDVGQADATLIEQSGEFCLIDAGDLSSGEVVVNYLKAAGVQELDMMIMTHEHADHIGGMVDVMESFEVELVLLPDFSKSQMPDGYNILRTLEFIDVEGIPEKTAQVGDVFALGEGTITVLDTGLIDPSDANNTSVITMFEVDGYRYLSCGDAEIEQTTHLVEENADIMADIYKAAHHGAQNGNYDELLYAVNPSVVIVSCGKDNSYGHPHEEALAAFEKVNANVFGTHEVGNIVLCITDTDELYVATDSQETVKLDYAA